MGCLGCWTFSEGEKAMVLRKYEDVVFLQGDDADAALDLIDKHGWAMGMDYLMQWEYGEPTDVIQHKGGYPDLMFHDNHYVERDGYMMGYNHAFTVAALWRVTDHVDYPHEADTLYDCAGCAMPD